MGKSINKVILLGSVGKEPEMRILPRGSRVVSFPLATAERYREQSGEWKEKTEWHNIVAYGPIVDVIEKYVKKGSRLYIDGRIETRSWESNGAKQYKTEIKVEDLVLAGDSEPRQPAARPAAATPAAPPESNEWDDFR